MGAMEDLLAPAVHAPLQPVSSSLLSRRRKSRSHSSAASSTPQVDQTSPEVITSLISSLSTISVPLQTHFDNVPRLDLDTDPSSPIFSLFFPSESQPAADQPPPSEHGFGVSYGAHSVPEEGSNNPFLHPDDAAAAPVIRMARAPPSPKSKSAAVPPLSPGRPPSRSSYTSVKAVGEDTAFGMITSEPGPRVSTAPSIASTGSAGRRSLKSQLGLLKRSSREFMSDKDKQVDRLRKTSSYNDSLRHNIPRNRTSLRSMHSMADVAEEGRLDHFSKEARHEIAASAPPSRDHSSSQSARASISSTPGGIGSGRVIPARESSLRHSFSSSTRKHRSTRHSRYSSTASRETKVDNNGGSDVANEAEQVTRRIQELKDQQQRIKTELEMDDSPEKSRQSSRQPVRPARQSTDLDEHFHKQESSVFEESAPAPAVMTGRNRTGTRNESALNSTPPNLPIQCHAVRQSFDKPGSIEKFRPPQSFEPSTPTRNHNRAPSNPASPNHASINDERPSSADSIDFAVLEYISSPKLTQKVPHPTTGRAIAFSEVGDPRGHVVLCCLGMGLTRYLMAFYDELARSLNLRLVTLDRPGVGESAPYVEEAGNPLSWPDDVAVVCNHLKVNKFSILAHSAGAIYALATALRIPQHIRGRIHLLAPWIPPSQLSSIGSHKEPVPTNAVPYSQRILRALPASFLKVANSSFMSATSASITSSLPKAPRRTRRRATGKESSPTMAAESIGTQSKIHQQGDDLKALQNIKPPTIATGAKAKKAEATPGQTAAILNEDRERQSDYDTRLTHKIWELATTNANPAVDLLVCLERRQQIGFRYVDITRNVVIHHGSRDTRVPVDNVRWLGKTMRWCEVRVLEGEGHGLMASATVMGNVLMEIAKEWEDWMTVVQGRRRGTVGPRPGFALPS